MPTEASDIAGPVRKPPFPHKQNLEPEVLYNRYTYVSNIKLAAQKKDGIARRAVLQAGAERARTHVKIGKNSADFRPKAMVVEN
jgi:hypothetical protein